MIEINLAGICAPLAGRGPGIDERQGSFVIGNGYRRRLYAAQLAAMAGHGQIRFQLLECSTIPSSFVPASTQITSCPTAASFHG